MFEDRDDAGRRLAAELEDRGIHADLVLAVPRGGLPIGRAVADALGAPLDVAAAKKLGAPDNPELAIGAAAATGAVWLNDSLLDRLGVSSEYVAAERERAAATAREKEAAYRGEDAFPDVTGKAVVLVDDGVATGATIRACVAAVRERGAARVVLAVPVCAPDAAAALEREVDEFVCLESPVAFGAVGQHYRRFDQVSDGEAMAYLE